MAKRGLAYRQAGPLEGKYPSWSPYHYNLNNPINNIDLYGLNAIPSPNTGYDLWNNLSEFGIRR